MNENSATGDAAGRLDPGTVSAASNAWIWIPDDAQTAETDDYLLIRYPDHFDHPLELARFATARPLGAAVDEALERASEFGLPALHWLVRIDSPPGVPELLAARDARLTETLDVLARGLAGGAPELPAPAADVDLRWATDTATARDGAAVGAEVFGGSLPPEDRLAASAERDREGLAGGRGGTVVAYVGGQPAGSGGVSIVDGVARLWGGAVLAPDRGQGVYRAVLAARLAYAAARGATMALVKGRVETSGPILRQAGFRPYGRELTYEVPLAPPAGG